MADDHPLQSHLDNLNAAAAALKSYIANQQQQPDETGRYKSMGHSGSYEKDMDYVPSDNAGVNGKHVRKR